jgi:homoserine dehydrogenase
MVDKLRVGLAGLGTVGAAAVRILTQRADILAAAAGCPIEIGGVSARDRERDRGVDLSPLRWFDDPVEMARDPDIDVVVELIGGSNGPALALIRTAIDNGKSVVSANKALLAKHGVDLALKAEAKGVALNFEAAVAGGIPVVKTLREALTANHLTRVFGILNGTCNYILTQMEEEDLSFADALAEAQKLGYAEADPTSDVGGFDAAYKLALLSSLAFGTKVDMDGVYVEGISSITALDMDMAEELGYRIKLLGFATRTPAGIDQRVHPTMVPRTSAMGQVNGVINAVALKGDAVGELALVGPGAGGNATASAVIADIVDVARGARHPVFGVPAAELAVLQRAPIQTHEGGYYIRLSVFDKPGAMAAIAARMAEQHISLDSILQWRDWGKKIASNADSMVVPVVLITHATTESALRSALEAVVKDGYVDGQPQTIRIEKE